jgi:hypothetical protein
MSRYWPFSQAHLADADLVRVRIDDPVGLDPEVGILGALGVAVAEHALGRKDLHGQQRRLGEVGAFSGVGADDRQVGDPVVGPVRVEVDAGAGEDGELVGGRVAQMYGQAGIHEGVVEDGGRRHVKLSLDQLVAPPVVRHTCQVVDVQGLVGCFRVPDTHDRHTASPAA